jgi:hypothetical protein
MGSTKEALARIGWSNCKGQENEHAMTGNPSKYPFERPHLVPASLSRAVLKGRSFCSIFSTAGSEKRSRRIPELIEWLGAAAAILLGRGLFKRLPVRGRQASPPSSRALDVG